MIEYGTNENWVWKGNTETVQFDVTNNGERIVCRVSRECIEDNLGNLTRTPIIRRLKADDGTDLETVSFGSPRRVLAFITMTNSDPRHDLDSGDMYTADIRCVDGARPGGFFSFGGTHLGASGADSNLLSTFFVGTAEDIQFRLRSFQGATVWGIGVVINIA